MAEKITDDQVENLLRVLRSDAAVDAKVNHVTALKSGIKQHNVPDHLVPSIFDALRLASSSQHAVLVNAGFTSLNHLLTRLSRQEPRLLSKEVKATLPLVIDKLGDQKEKFRSLAAQALTTMYGVAPADVERMVRNVAMAGKNPRAKEAGMQWVLQMHQEHGLQFRGYVPTLMDLLEDADGMVRDVAKATVIELFRNSPNAAKSDLKRQLKNFKVRPAIEQAIVKELLPSGTRPETPADMAPPNRPNLAASTSVLPNERPITPAPEIRNDKAEPSYVNTQRELDDLLRDMHSHFEGRESEQNWLKREESVKKLRRLIAGNVAQDFREPFLLGLKALLDGIIKAVNSLRTSLSKEGCALVQDIAHAFGPGMDPLVELLMQTFIKLCAATKKIASQQANATVEAIVGRASYNNRIMQHVWGACQDKNVQPRTYAADWLQTILKKEGHHKSHIEHNGGVELFEKCIKKGLNDSNPGVREKMRSTYWAFASYWPARAEVIMDNLDATAQKLLNKDSHNPGAAKKAEEVPVRPGMGLSRSTMATSSKPSLREAMLAQKKAMSGRNLPARPGSAMAHISPARTVSGSSNMSTATTSSTATGRPRPESTVSGGMSVRPMRPTKKRPEQPQRPATAGPYSPAAFKAVASPRVSPAKPQPSPRASPAKPVPAPINLASSPTKANEEITLLVPSVENLSLKETSPAPQEPQPEPQLEPASPVPHVAAELEVSATPEAAPATPKAVVQSPQKEISATPSKTLKVFEDPFTKEDQTTPKPVIVIPVLEDRPVNENAGVPAIGQLDPNSLTESPEKSRQNTKLLESGITRVKARSLDVHGFRKLQTLIRENRAVFTDEKFDALLTGLFEYLEAPLEALAPEKVQDVKAQILATIKLLLKKERDSFQPHVARGLEALVATRSAYDSRTHIVSGLELLSAELVTIGDASEMVMTMTKLLGDGADTTTEGCRCLSMGLHILKEVLEKREGYTPSEGELGQLAGLAGRCLESAESGVRMGAVQLCVALHARIGAGPFWEAVKTAKDDPKNLITYYIAKRQREQNGVGM
ncbi:hypothetical protein ACHAQH_002669 [Verticillium albo-atrum]